MIIYWDLGLGGIQKRLRDFVYEISQHYDNWHVYILLRRKVTEGFDSQIITGKNVTLLYYPFKKPLKTHIGFVLWSAAQIIKTNPDVVLTFLHVLSPVLIVLKRFLFWIPFKVVINEGILTSYHLSINHAVVFPFLVRATYPLADAIIVPTHACKQDLAKKFFVPSHIITVIPNWTCLPSVRPMKPVFDVLYVGRFHPEKNPLAMIRITQRLVMRHPHIRVAMIGNGELLSDLHKGIVDAHLFNNIRILPFSQNVAHVLRQSKMLMVPSFAEGMPNVVLEAAMCGVPAVVNHFPGADEVVRHGKTGYISEAVNDAADSIDYLLRHEQKRKRMGIAAQRYVAEHFSRVTQKCFIETLVS